MGERTLGLDVGVSTGYCVLENGVRLQGGEVNWADVSRTEQVNNLVKEYMPKYIVLEYPVLNKANPLYNLLVDINKAFTEITLSALRHYDIPFDPNAELPVYIRSITPSQWKPNERVQRFIAETYKQRKASRHEKDACGIARYWELVGSKSH